ncbi:hypothetical protein MPL3365_250153 [Mesorhizobium plurifarium]|uniref:Uncharacterized protein n=1 Tax=Mesorhizobium plurifarium TaxID=69974 RepID=A0A090GCA1_MESPL|nr:hypothetical protein MPL3365_250153 [Mesorhizobium plurifarium]
MGPVPNAPAFLLRRRHLREFGRRFARVEASAPGEEGVDFTRVPLPSLRCKKASPPFLSSSRHMQIAGQGHVAAIIAVDAGCG